MKKRGLLVITAVMTAAMLTGCCSHDFKSATCEDPQICKECGETQGSARGHKWNGATCEKPETCDECGETRGEALGHKFSEATCVEPEICSVCGAEGEAALGHDFTEATCTRPEMCNTCGELGDSASGHSWTEATYYAPATCTVCGETSGDKLTRPSEWGFYNLEEMGNGIVEITAYNLSKPGNEYVVVTGKMRQFENGYHFRKKIVEKDGKCTLQATGHTPSKYEIVNNDTFTYENGYSSCTINERKTVSTRDDFVVFSMIVTWYIPYNLIDWDRGMDTITNEDGTTSNIMYLVPKT